MTCPNTQCSYSDIESAAGNSASVDLSAEFVSTTQGIATFTLSQGFVTGGVLRSGWMQLTIASDGDYGYGSSSIGTGMFDGTFGCTGTAQIRTVCYDNSLQPILLGQTLPLAMQIQIARSALSPGVIDGGTRELFIQAQFFEVDPLTGSAGAPVQVSLAPEPAALWPCGAALIAAAFVRRRAANRTHSPCG